MKESNISLTSFKLNLWRAPLSLALLALILSGCNPSSSQRISAKQVEMDNLKREIRFLKQQNSQFLRELDDLKKKIAELELTNSQVKADVAAKVDELMQQMDAVRNNIQDTNSRLSSINRETKPPVSRQTSQSGITTTGDSTAAKSAIKSQPFSEDQSKELYNTAYRDLIRGNYQLALQGFQQFVTQYQNSDLIDNAQYWIGEVYYAQGRY